MCDFARSSSPASLPPWEMPGYFSLVPSLPLGPILVVATKDQLMFQSRRFNICSWIFLALTLTGNPMVHHHTHAFLGSWWC